MIFHRLISILIVIATPVITGLDDRKPDRGSMLMSILDAVDFDLNHAERILVHGLYGNQAAISSDVMETLKLKSMVEHKVYLALDGLKDGQPMETRRASLLSLVSISHVPMAMKVLRDLRMVKPIVDAIMGLKLDDTSTNLAALALYYTLTSDVDLSIEKEPFRLIDFVAAKGIEKIKEAHNEKEKNMKQKQCECAQLKMVTTTDHIDNQVLKEKEEKAEVQMDDDDDCDEDYDDYNDNEDFAKIIGSALMIGANLGMFALGYVNYREYKEHKQREFHAQPPIISG